MKYYKNLKNLYYIIGFDIGIASIGWSLLKTDKYGTPYKIIMLDSLVWNKSEDRTGKTLATSRRLARATRRLLRRTKYRKHHVNKLFRKYHLLTKSQEVQAFYHKGYKLEPLYQLEVKGLSRPLNNTELYRVLYHLIHMRGFYSNRKSNASSKNIGRLKKAIINTKQSLKKYKLPAKLLYHQQLLGTPASPVSVRNHNTSENGFKHGFTRQQIITEAKDILNCQMKYHKISMSFSLEYLHYLSMQIGYEDGPFKPSQYAATPNHMLIDNVIGFDGINPKYQRAAKGTYTFEKYRMWQTLNDIKLKNSKYSINIHYLTLNQKNKIARFCFTHSKVTYYQLRVLLKLDNNIRFNFVDYSEDSKPVTCEKHTTFANMSAIYKINKLLPNPLKNNKFIIDKVGEILTKCSTVNKSYKLLKSAKLSLSNKCIGKLSKLDFSGFGKFSLNTMARLLLYMTKGHSVYYSQTQAHLPHRAKINLKYIRANVNNPEILRVFSNFRKLLNAIIRKFGNPLAIHIELARDLHKSLKQRKQIEKYNKKNAKVNESIKKDLKKHDINPNNPWNIIIEKLYKSQSGLNPYNIFKPLNPSGDYRNLFTNQFNVDHIIPWNWSFDSHLSNLVLTTNKDNEEKGEHYHYITTKKNILVKYLNL